MTARKSREIVTAACGRHEKEELHMMHYNMAEAAAAVAANHRMGRRDVLDIARFALGLIAVPMALLALLMLH